MSQEDPKDAATDAPTDAPKKKRGFWSWLTGATPDAPPETPAAAEETAAEPLSEGAAPAAAEAEAAQAPAVEAVPAQSERSGAGAEQAAPAGAAEAGAPLLASDDAGVPVAEHPSAYSEAPAAAPAQAERSGAGAEQAAPVRVPAGAAEPVAELPPALSEQPGTVPAPAETEPAASPAAPASPAVALEDAVAPSEPPLAAALGSAPLSEAAQASPPPVVAAPEAPAQVLVEQGGGEADLTSAEVAEETALPAAAEPQPMVEAPATAALEPVSEAPAKKGFWSRLVSGLARTASNLGQGITDLVSKRKLDAETLEELEDVLIRADLGVETAMRIVEEVGRGRHDKMISPEEVKGLIAAEVEAILAPVAKPLVVEKLHRPFVVLMVGVNGSGKTTTIGKLAAQWRSEGRKVVLAAGDTFRAAAIEQLKVWGARTGTRVIARAPGSDAAGVAHDALTEARAEGADILLIDTAGRLQNRAELMAELEKIVRVVKKLEPSAPHAVLLVLDATVGQNALSQVEAFTRIAGVTGLVMTKLDGTARGGILVAIAAKHKLPIHLIGVGEGADDLQPFAARDFARAIAGLE